MPAKKMGNYPIKRLSRAALRSLVIAGLCSGNAFAQGPCVLSVYSENHPSPEVATPPSLTFQPELASATAAATSEASDSLNSSDLARAMTQYVIQIVGLGNRCASGEESVVGASQEEQSAPAEPMSPETKTTLAESSDSLAEQDNDAKRKPAEKDDSDQDGSLLDLVLPAEMAVASTNPSGSGKHPVADKPAEHSTAPSESSAAGQVFHLSDDDVQPTQSGINALEATTDESIVKSATSTGQVETQGSSLTTSMPTFQPSLFKPSLNKSDSGQSTATGPSIVAGSSQRQFALRLVKSSSKSSSTGESTGAKSEVKADSSQSGLSSDYSPIATGMPVVRAVKPPVEPQAEESAEKSQAVPRVASESAALAAIEKTSDSLVRVAGKQDNVAKPEDSEKVAAVTTKQDAVEDKRILAADNKSTSDKSTSDKSETKAAAAEPNGQVAGAPIKEPTETAESKLCRQLVDQVRQKFPNSRIAIQPHPEEGLIVSGQAASESEARKILTFVRITSLSPTFDEIKATR